MAHPDPHLTMSMFSGPIPGQSLTHAPKSMPWEKPPQHTDLQEVMPHLMMQLTEPMHMKALLQLMDGGMSIEAITRVILFTGFTTGQWTPTLAMLMYKPLMLTLMAFAHKAGMKNTPMVLKESLDKHVLNRIRKHVLVKSVKGEHIGMELPTEPPQPEPQPQPIGNGFIKRPS